MRRKARPTESASFISHRCSSPAQTALGCQSLPQQQHPNP
jgi:hypothetical protein